MNRILRGRALRSTNWIEDTRGELALEALGIPTRPARALYAAGYRTREDIAASPDRELLAVPGIGPARLAATRAAVPYVDQLPIQEAAASDWLERLSGSVAEGLLEERA